MTKLKLLPYILFAGLIADAGYLSSKYYDFYYRGGFLESLGCTSGCDTVMMSPQALILKIPVPFYGLAFYLLTLTAYIYWHRSHCEPKAKQSSPSVIAKQSTVILESLLTLGCAAALVFIYVLYFQIHASCKFCLAAHGMFFILTAIYFLLIKSK